MAIYETEAIVLGASNWSDSDKIITLFSKDRGKIKAIAYGSRKSKSNLSSLAQLFNVANLQLTQVNRGLDIIRNYEHQYFLADFSLDYLSFGYASFIAELVIKLFEIGDNQPQLYDKLLKIIPLLTKKNPKICSLIAFYQIMECTGYQLQYNYCVKCNKKIVGDNFLSFKEGGTICSSCCSLNKDKIPYSEKLRLLINDFLNFSWNDETLLF